MAVTTRLDPYYPNYYSKEQVKSELAPIWEVIKLELGSSVSSLDVEAKKAHTAYQNARKNNLDFIALGGDSLREMVDFIQNVGTLSSEKPLASPLHAAKFFRSLDNSTTQEKAMRQASTHLSAGAVINDDQWNILRNDAFMLGAIHEKKDFHLMYPSMTADADGIPDDSLLWDAVNNRPRALGRELLMLSFAGYQPVVADLEEQKAFMFNPPEESIAEPLSFSGVREKLAGCTIDTIKDFLGRGLISPVGRSSAGAGSSARR